MYKSIHSPQNQVLLALLRDHRRSRRLRQIDVGLRLGKDQAMVSKVESGERRLDVIELRAWLQAIDVDFVAFIRELEVRLSRL
jgi:transcriptional regulator with XRE-family HTH domain